MCCSMNTAAELLVQEVLPAPDGPRVGAAAGVRHRQRVLRPLPGHRGGPAGTLQRRRDRGASPEARLETLQQDPPAPPPHRQAQVR